jgi:hypothetical protein
MSRTLSSTNKKRAEGKRNVIKTAAQDSIAGCNLSHYFLEVP